MEELKPKADLLFEVSWEVCNKVGGINTVVKSKAAQMVNYYKDNYFLIGPYFMDKAAGEFGEEPPDKFCKKPFEELKKEGIVCHKGKWLTDGTPNVILIDFEGFKNKTNDIKKEFWDHYKVDSLRSDDNYSNPLVWSYSAGKLIEMLTNKKKNIVVHVHEWLSGGTLLYLKKHKSIKTVFTTHATVLGRTLATSNADLYNIWDKIDPDKEAYDHVVEFKHLLEKQCALNADVFTTVSEITSMEANNLLGKKADILVLNGLDIEKFPTFEEIAIKHEIQRERIKEFLIYYFFPYYTFDIKETLIFFIVGRYEFRDKGIDILIKALKKLNEKLKNSNKTIVAFFWIPTRVRNIKPELLENKTFYEDIKDSLDEVEEEVQRRIMESIITNKKISNNSLFDKNFSLEIKSKANRFKKRGNPGISTHDLHQENDQIINALKESNLNNKKEDHVKVIYYPIYLSGADSLLDLSYYEAIQGSHLGILPSYYEPWGYTPLETGALGVACVTTDLAGFGRFFFNESTQGEYPGIYVLKRFNKSDKNAVNQLADIMYKFSTLTKEERIRNKIQARNIASTADWKIFIKNYVKAHNMALEK